MSIDKLLESYHMATLQKMAEAAGLSVKDEKGKKLNKRDLRAMMKEKYFSRARVLASLKKLNKREKAVLERIQLRGGEVTERKFRRELLLEKLASDPPRQEQPERRAYYSYNGVYGQSGYAGSPDRINSSIYEDVIARLTYHGLVFSKKPPMSSATQAYKLKFHPTKTIFIPQVVGQYLPEPKALPQKKTNWQPTRLQSGDPAVLLRNLYLYWDHIRWNPAELLQSGFVGKRSLKALNKILMHPDPSFDKARREDEAKDLYLLRLLLQQLGLLRKYGGRLLPVEDKKNLIPAFWNKSTPEQAADYLEAWSSLYQFNALGAAAAQYRPNYRSAYRSLIEILKKLPADAWSEAEGLLIQLQDANIDFLISSHSDVETRPGGRFNAYIGGSYFYGDRDTLLEKFEQFESDFVDYVLKQMLLPLGLVELGYISESRYVFKLTPLGRVALGMASLDELPAQDTGKVVLQPNFHLLAMGPVSLAILSRLDIFADRQQVDQGVFEYQLTKDSVYRAQQMGFSAGEIIQWLSETTGQTPPQNVRRSLQEWGAHHERIVFRSGVNLMQTARSDLLDALLDSPKVNRHLERALTPEVALIKAKKKNALVSDLLAMEILPAVSDANPESADHSVVIQPDGAIQLVHAAPSLHLRGRLAKLAEESSAGAWRLTGASIRRAGGSKAKVLGILKELGKLNRGPLPEELATRVKAWGRYYGQIAAETLTLIEFQDREIMTEIMQRPELQGLLNVFPTQKRALAVVAAENLAQVKDTLAKLGAPLKEGLKAKKG